MRYSCASSALAALTMVWAGLLGRLRPRFRSDVGLPIENRAGQRRAVVVSVELEGLCGTEIVAAPANGKRLLGQPEFARRILTQGFSRT